MSFNASTFPYITNGTVSNSVFDNFENIFSFVVGMLGAGLNFFILSAFYVGNYSMSEPCKILLKSQLMLDALAGTSMVIRLFDLPLFPQFKALFLIMCVVFKQGMLLFALFAASVYNVVAIAAQRFVITVFPFKKISNWSAYLSGLGSFAMGVSLNAFWYGMEMEVDAATNRCYYKYTSKEASIVWTTFYLVVPTVTVTALYTKITLVLRHNKKSIRSTSAGKNRESRLVKNAMTIAIIYVMTTSTNTITSAMIFFGALDGQFWDKYIRFPSYACTMLNSASTPVVYLIFLNNIRRNALKILTCGRFAKQGKTESINNSSVVTNATSTSERA